MTHNHLKLPSPEEESYFPQEKDRASQNRKHHYEITVEGHLDEHWSEWLDGFVIIHSDDGNSQLSGTIADQAALHGILIQIRDLGLTLISIQPKNSDNETNAS